MGRYLGIQINKLKLVELIGKGGMGEVYRARHEVLERDFAVKILKKEIRSDMDAARRFEREARAASRLAHPNIVYISDFGMLSSGELYIVMEYLAGFSLRQMLRQRGPLPVNKVCGYMAQVAEALDFAHRMGVVHRDLKSENVMVVRQGDKEIVKILDFGLAKLTEEGKGASLTGQGEIFGTPESMAPEQISNDPITPKVDIYALGILGYELLVGRPPFTGGVVKVLLAHKKERPKPPSIYRSDIPKPLEWMIMKALEKKPENRFHTAGEVAEICWKILEYRTSSGEMAAIPNMDETRPGDPLVGESERLTPDRSSQSQEMGAPDVYDSIADEVSRLWSAEVSTVGQNEWIPDRVSGDAVDERDRVVTEWRSVLKELGTLIMERGFRGNDIPEMISLLHEKEEEHERVGLEYRSVLSEFHQYEKTIREQESRLMHALISLMATAKMQALAEGEDSSVVMDLQFQIGELRKNLMVLDDRRIKKEEEFDDRVLRLSLVLDDLEDDMDQVFMRLDKQVEYIRHQVSLSPVVREMFARLDRLRLQVKG